jgi:hypothetical protein
VSLSLVIRGSDLPGAWGDWGQGVAGSNPVIPTNSSLRSAFGRADIFSHAAPFFERRQRVESCEPFAQFLCEGVYLLTITELATSFDTSS